MSMKADARLVISLPICHMAYPLVGIRRRGAAVLRLSLSDHYGQFNHSMGWLPALPSP
jgi:hypothetical protein